MKRLWPTPLYTFLEVINFSKTEGEKKVLECGAGGRHPPLGLFYEEGYEPWGIDISDAQIERTLEFCSKTNINLTILQGDMRAIPFKDESFSFVYELYSLCHLTKKDISTTVGEMARVLKKGGLWFLGFMSLDIWPLPGKEVNSGEFYFYENGNPVVHSLYGDDEPDAYFAGLDIIYKEKKSVLYHEGMARKSREKWIEEYDTCNMKEWAAYSREEWARMVEEISRFNWSELYYVVRKPL